MNNDLALVLGAATVLRQPLSADEHDLVKQVCSESLIRTCVAGGDALLNAPAAVADLIDYAVATTSSATPLGRLIRFITGLWLGRAQEMRRAWGDMPWRERQNVFLILNAIPAESLRRAPESSLSLLLELDDENISIALLQKLGNDSAQTSGLLRSFMQGSESAADIRRLCAVVSWLERLDFRQAELVLADLARRARKDGEKGAHAELLELLCVFNGSPGISLKNLVALARSVAMVRALDGEHALAAARRIQSALVGVMLHRAAFMDLLVESLKEHGATSLHPILDLICNHLLVKGGETERARVADRLSAARDAIYRKGDAHESRVLSAYIDVLKGDYDKARAPFANSFWSAVEVRASNGVAADESKLAHVDPIDACLIPLENLARENFKGALSLIARGRMANAVSLSTAVHLLMRFDGRWDALTIQERAALAIVSLSAEVYFDRFPQMNKRGKADYAFDGLSLPQVGELSRVLLREAQRSDAPVSLRIIISKQWQKYLDGGDEEIYAYLPRRHEGESPRPVCEDAPLAVLVRIDPFILPPKTVANRLSRVLYTSPSDLKFIAEVNPRWIFALLLSNENALKDIPTEAVVKLPDVLTNRERGVLARLLPAEVRTRLGLEPPSEHWFEARLNAIHVLPFASGRIAQDLSGSGGGDVQDGLTEQLRGLVDEAVSAIQRGHLPMRACTPPKTIALLPERKVTNAARTRREPTARSAA